MIDYIDNCFSLIQFPDDEFIEYQQKNFFNIDNLFIFNDDLKIERMHKRNANNPYTTLFSNYFIWGRNIQSMRYDLEISLMFLLYYFNKGIPEHNNDIEDVYTKYNWSKADISLDDKNPSNIELYKKLFNTFSNYFIHSLITFVNNIENQIVYVFNFKNDKIFSYKNNLSVNDLNVFADEIKPELINFINKFKDFLYNSQYKELREFRNTMVHKNTPFIFRMETKIFKPDNMYAISSISEEASSTKLVNDIKASLILVEHQCKMFNEIVNKYFKLLCT